MIWIELLGPSGVGKSHIYTEIIKKYNFLQPYQNIAYKSLLTYLLPKNNKFKAYFNKRSIINELNKFKIDYNHTDVETIRVFLESLEVFTDNPIVKLNLCNYFSYKLRELKFYDSKLQNNDVFFSEDGLIHLLISGITDENLTKIHKPDLIINLKASEDYIKRNRLKRIKNNLPNFVERSTSKEELINSVFPKNYSLYYEKTELLRKSYCKDFYELDIEKLSISQIITKIYSITTKYKS